MSNIVSIGLPRRPNRAQRQAVLLENFALNRRSREDVYWLKENAELLNILATTSEPNLPHAFDVYRQFYDSIEERLKFFPQYYRFLLSICLDLEALGIGGNKGEALCHWVRRSDLAVSELSDLQRAEAERLLARGNAATPDPALADRLRAFIEHSATFALPNKKAAYELTHIVFYLSDYGTRSPELAQEAVTSLEFAGLLAYLDQDIDLLSEVCVALRFAGVTPSEIWEDWLALELGSFVLEPAAPGAVQDAYHEYLVTSWWADLAGFESFPGMAQKGGLRINWNGARKGPLRAISEVMFQLGPARSSDWRQMWQLLERKLEADQHHILCDAAQSSDQFDAFFQRFSRATL